MMMMMMTGELGLKIQNYCEKTRGRIISICTLQSQSSIDPQNYPQRARLIFKVETINH